MYILYSKFEVKFSNFAKPKYLVLSDNSSNIITLVDGLHCKYQSLFIQFAFASVGNQEPKVSYFYHFYL